MATQIVVGELRTGRNLVYIPASGVSDVKWTVTRNQADDLKVTFNLADDITYSLGIPEAAAEGAAFMVVVIDDVPVAGGPVWMHNWSDDDQKLTVTAKGMWSYFDHRVLIPLVSQTLPVIDPASGEPYAVMNTNLVGLSYGTIAKRIVQTAVAFTGGQVPIVFMDDETGPYERNYLGTDLAMIGERLSQLTGIIDGPDIAFVPRWTVDRQGMEWHLITGTLDEPNISGDVEHVWDYSVPKPSIKSLQVQRNASNLVSRAWVSGGRTDDVTRIEKATDLTLLDAGYPLLESVESSDAETSSLLQSRATETVRINRVPRSQWSFKVRADGDPRLTDIAVGDYCRVIIGDRHRYLAPSGPEGYRRRIAALSGDKDGLWVDVTVMESYG